MGKQNYLSSLEYAGLEYVFQKIIDTYENEYFGTESYEHTPVSEITRRNRAGLSVFDGVFNMYQIGDYAIKGVYAVLGCCILSGFKIDGDLEECFVRQADLFINITELLDEKTVDIDYLLEKLEEAEQEV